MSAKVLKSPPSHGASLTALAHVGTGLAIGNRRGESLCPMEAEPPRVVSEGPEHPQAGSKAAIRPHPSRVHGGCHAAP